MTDKTEVKQYVESQKSLHLYKKAQEAFVDVLSRLSEEEFHIATDNLIIMAMHEGATGQVMHFPDQKGNFIVMQLSLPKGIPYGALKSVIAHELGHVMQGRNWRESDGNELEDDANRWADKWGLGASESDMKWLQAAREIPPSGSRS
jgi:hypothetical protein